jgi:hypothetical protein
MTTTVMVLFDRRLTMAVQPESFRVDLYRLKKDLGAPTVQRTRVLFDAAFWQSVWNRRFRRRDENEISFNAESHGELSA